MRTHRRHMSAAQRLRWAYVRERSIEFFVAAGALVAAIVYALTPGAFDQTSIGANVPAWLAAAWVAGYVAGGMGVCVGRLLPSLRVEQIGLLVLAGACAANAGAIVIARGGQGAATTCLFTGIAMGMVLRAQQIARTGR